jgi:hypothetical protein
MVCLSLSQIFYGQDNKGLCKVEVNDVSKVTSLGYLVGLTIEFKNNTKKTVDGIYWTTYFFDNANKVIKTEEDSFNSSSNIDPIVSGFTKTIVRAPRIKGASKVAIVINKIHFSDGSGCK